MKKLLLLPLILLAALLFSYSVAAAAVPTGSAANNPASWVTHLKNDKGVDAQCYKHEADHDGDSNTEHGRSDEDRVRLVTFNQSWYGDHWALLVIKAGTENRVIYNPQAGVWYSSPQNKDVSHWIVCKGVTPTPPPTTTVPPPTTTTPPPTTTLPPVTTEPPTTTLPPVSTTLPVPPSTQPPVVTTPPTKTVDVPSTTSTPPVFTDHEPPAVAPPTELAHTGIDTLFAMGVAAGVILLGVILLAVNAYWSTGKRVRPW